MITQIYGITTPEDASAVAALGADRIGIVVCTDESLTPDGNSLERAQEIKAAIPVGVTVNALTFSSDVDEIADMLGALKPDVLHLTQSPALFPVSEIRRLMRKVPGLRVMQAIPVTGPEALEVAIEFQEIAESILLDTAHESISDKIGATGQTHDWTISRRIVERLDVPVILAGGLSHENVAAAIRAVRPWGVDSYTLTSVAGDLKRKDLDLVRRFIDAAVRAGQEEA